MKTLAIYDDGDGEVIFTLFDGDYSHLHGVYINDANTEKEKEDELLKLVYDSDGRKICKELTIAQAEEEIRNGAKMILCGFQP